MNCGIIPRCPWWGSRLAIYSRRCLFEWQFASCWTLAIIFCRSWWCEWGVEVEKKWKFGVSVILIGWLRGIVMHLFARNSVWNPRQLLSAHNRYPKASWMTLCVISGHSFEIPNVYVWRPMVGHGKKTKKCEIVSIIRLCIGHLVPLFSRSTLPCRFRPASSVLKRPFVK